MSLHLRLLSLSFIRLSIAIYVLLSLRADWMSRTDSEGREVKECKRADKSNFFLFSPLRGIPKCLCLRDTQQ